MATLILNILQFRHTHISYIYVYIRVCVYIYTYTHRMEGFVHELAKKCSLAWIGNRKLTPEFLSEVES